MSAEKDSTASGSEKDKDMMNRKAFSAENSPEVKDTDDDDDEESDSKEDKKTASEDDRKARVPRNLLFGPEKTEEKPEATEKPRGLFAGILKEVAPETSETPPEPEVTPEVAEVEPAEQAFDQEIDERIAEIQTEVSEATDDVARAEASADAAYLQAVEQARAGELSPEEAIEAALENVDPELAAELDAVEGPEAIEITPVELELAEADAEEEVDDQNQQTTTPPTPTPIPQPTAKNPPPPPPTPRPNVPTGLNPPRPPQPPFGGGPQFNRQPSPNVQPNPNVQPPTPNVQTGSQINSLQRRRSGDLLLGGVAGFLYGRRRGRLGAEGRLMPEIERRQKTIEELKAKLAEREVAVRTKAAERVIETSPRVEKIIDRTHETVSTERTAERVVERAADAPKSPERVPERRVEVSSTPKMDRTPERSAEAHLSAMKERERPIEQRKDVRTMTVSELLEVGSNIYLENTSLRQLYERGRIDAVNLRRVVIEYAQGGQRYERIMRSSLEAVEMQRELRNEIRQDGQSTWTPLTVQAAQSQGATDTTQLSAQSQAGSAQGQAQPTAPVAKKPQPQGVQTKQFRAPVISAEAAILLGIIGGVLIILLILLFSR